MMRYLSVCSGIESATVAWHPLGWSPVFFSEIAPFPCAVLKHHYPHVTNVGDMTKFREWPDAAIDLLVGGTPCQSFSIAGLRKGLDDPRGNLMLTYLAIAERYRPVWLVWENVPGVLSSNKGRDFGAFLGGLAKLGYGFAYRILDAQYIRVDGFARAVPQRRRRVFVVGHLGNWRTAAAVLFERESLCGNPAPSREARQSIAPTISARTQGGGGLGTDFDLGGGLVANSVAATLTRGARMSPDAETYIANTPTCFSIQAGATRENVDSGPDGIGVQSDLAYTIESRSEVQAICFDETQITSTENRCNPQAGDPSHPLSASARAPAIAFDCKAGGDTGFAIGEVPGSLRGEGHSGGHSAIAEPLSSGYAVRRLTPRECERLQGFPEQRKTCITLVCSSDQQRLHALAEIQNPKSPTYASIVAASDSMLSAESAAPLSSISLLCRDWPVAAHALIDLDRAAVQIRRAGKLLWSANDVAEPSPSPLRMPVRSFAHLGALLTRAWEPTVQHGRAGLLRLTSSSFLLPNGSVLALVSGPESVALASDAATFTAAVSRFTKCTISDRGPNSPNSEPNREISLCCATAAISGFIPSETKIASSYAIILEAHLGYTSIQYRGKPAADGPRYKALGNSKAVNCVRWIGQRIQIAAGLSISYQAVA